MVGAASLSRSAEKVEAAGFLLRSPIKPGSGRGSTSFLAQLFSHPRDNSLIHSIVSGVRTLLSIYQTLLQQSQYYMNPRSRRSTSSKETVTSPVNSYKQPATQHLTELPRVSPVLQFHLWADVASCVEKPQGSSLDTFRQTSPMVLHFRGLRNTPILKIATQEKFHPLFVLYQTLDD